MIDEVRLFGSRSAGRQAVLDRLDGSATGLIGDAELRNATVILSQAVFAPPLPVILAGGPLPNGDFSADTLIAEPAETSDQALVALRRVVGVLPKQHKLTLCLEVESGVPRFVGALEDARCAGRGKALAELPPPAPSANRPRPSQRGSRTSRPSSCLSMMGPCKRPAMQPRCSTS